MDFKLVCNSYTNVMFASGTFSFSSENDSDDSNDNDVTFDVEYATCKDTNSLFYITYVEYDADKDKYECMYLHCIAHDVVQTGDKKQADLFKFCREDGKTFINLVSKNADNINYYLCMSPDQNYLALRCVDGYDNNYIKCEVVPV
jgi:hypothetical protein